MAGKLVWDGKEPTLGQEICRRLHRFVDSLKAGDAALPDLGPQKRPASLAQIRAESAHVASSLTELPFAYGLTDDPHSRSLNAMGGDE